MTCVSSGPHGASREPHRGPFGGIFDVSRRVVGHFESRSIQDNCPRPLWAPSWGLKRPWKRKDERAKSIEFPWGVSRGPRGALLRCLGALSGASWEPRGASPGNFGRHRSKEGRPRFPSPLCGYENRPWGPLGTFLGRYWAPLGPSAGPLGRLLGLPWAILEQY